MVKNNGVGAREDVIFEVSITEQQLNKRVYDTDVEGRRYRGRPYVRRLDIVKKSLKLADIEQFM